MQTTVHSFSGHSEAINSVAGLPVSGMGVPGHGDVGPFSSIYDVNTPQSLPPPSESPWIAVDYRDPEAALDDLLDSRTPAHRIKQIHVARKESLALLKRHPRNRACFITLTPEPGDDGSLDSLTLQRRINQIRPYLDSMFVEWMLVIEAAPGDDWWHAHGVGIAREDVRRGWSHQPYAEIAAIKRRAWQEGRRLFPDERNQVDAWSKCLTPNPALRRVWRHLNQNLPEAGFGRVHPAHVTPIEDAELVIGYTVKGLKTPTKELKGFKRGTRFLHFSRQFHRVYRGQFCWNTEKTRRERRYKTRIATALGFTEDECIDYFGKKWCWRLNKLVGALHRTSPGWVAGDDEAVEGLIVAALGNMGEGWAEGYATHLMLRQRERLGQQTAQRLQYGRKDTTLPTPSSTSLSAENERLIEDGTNVPAEIHQESRPSGSDEASHAPAQRSEAWVLANESVHMGRPDGRQWQPAVALSPRKKFSGSQ